jgi:hypothetical protein
MNEVALLLRVGMGEEGVAGVPGVPGVESPGVPGGVLIVSLIITAGLPGRVREDIETLDADITSSSGDPSSSKELELLYPVISAPLSSFLRRSRSNRKKYFWA